MSEKKFVYFFGGDNAEGNTKMKNLLGGKGANLAEMVNIGVPVPAGFTISTEVCIAFYENNHQYPEILKKEVDEHLKKIESVMGKKFNDIENPLLVSVRSGARVSMPGMMDTVLNLGLNDETVKGLVKQTNNERFAYDCYRRFVQMYGDVVLGMKPENKNDIDPFEEIIEKKKEELGIKQDTDLTAEALKELVIEFKKAIKKQTGKEFPENPLEQLWGAIGAVFGSWDTPRAIKYREINHIPGHWGTAVNVQAMVYGNMGNDCATGVAFTRDPATGEKVFYGEYLINAQGEDVVAGIRTPQPINIANKRPEHKISLEEEMPNSYKELVEIYQKLEKHYRDMQDIEFTVENNKLWLLQTRTGKRTAQAAVRIAIEMVDEKLINKEEAIMRIDPNSLDQLLHPVFDKSKKEKVVLLAKGLPASPGAATGMVVFNADDAEKWAEEKKKVILVRLETSPEDIGGMNVAEGILTARGGMTSHAAVVARGMGKCCVAGCGALDIDYVKREFIVSGKTIKEGDWISLDGSAGEVLLGKVETVKPELTGNFGILMKWANEIKRLGARTNADNPHDSQVAIEFGAEGIGLCRTEHMFFDAERISAVREMILSKDLAGRKKALAKIMPMQKEDFIGIFRVMNGLPVTIRTLDPPLHEFLPSDKEDIKKLAKEMGISFDELEAKIVSLEELNPMLGHRGCRLGIAYPEITEIQAQAIFEAACEVKKEGIDVKPEVMIPLIASKEELTHQKAIVKRIAEETIAKHKIKLDYLIGTMIELPRAALTADKVAEEAEFFSFGTNDLTQTTFGLSRDDAGKFLPMYVQKGILVADPFQKLDQEGVGILVKLAVDKGRETKPDLKIGICGEHGGEPSSVEFCHRIGLDYVSCSPYRVPIARLAAAQAVIREKE